MTSPSPASRPCPAARAGRRTVRARSSSPPPRSRKSFSCRAADEIAGGEVAIVVPVARRPVAVAQDPVLILAVRKDLDQIRAVEHQVAVCVARPAETTNAAARRRPRLRTVDLRWRPPRGNRPNSCRRIARSSDRPRSQAIVHGHQILCPRRSTAADQTRIEQLWSDRAKTRSTSCRRRPQRNPSETRCPSSDNRSIAMFPLTKTLPNESTSTPDGSSIIVPPIKRRTD